MTASKRQVGGGHYAKFRIQPSRYIFENGLSWPAGNIVKYASRAGSKGGREGMRQDIEKIIHYAQLWLEYEGFTDAPPVSTPAHPALSPDGADVAGLYRDQPRPCATCEGD
jgi:hypothetical protein